MGKHLFSAALIGVLALFTNTALADNTWEPTTSGLWDVDDNWSAGTVPLTGPHPFNTAVFTNSGTAVVSEGYAEYQLLHMRSLGTSAVISVTGGMLYGNTAVLGQNINTSGVVRITSGSWINEHAVTIGESGTGSLVISGGLMSSAEPITLGLESSGSGSIVLSGSAGNRGVLTTTRILKGEGAGTLHFDGGILQADDGGMDFLSGFGAGDVTIGAGNAYIDNGDYLSIAAPLSGTGTIIKQGEGTLILSGLNSHGGIRVESGVVRVNGGSSLGASVVLDGGALESGAEMPVSQQVTLGASSGTIMTTGGDMTLTTALTGAGGLTKTGSYTLSVSGTQTYLGETRVEDGTLQITNGVLTSTSVDLVEWESALLFTDNGSVAGTITGEGMLKREGAGATILTGTVSQGRGTVVSSGTLIVASGGLIDHAFGDVIVGERNGDTATLLISDGAQVSNFTAWLGYAAGSSGTARVNGGGVWNNREILVGQSGTGAIFIENGASVFSEYARIGFSSTAVGTVTVSGGTWNTGVTDGNLAVGFRGRGELLIESGLVTGSSAIVGEYDTSVGTTSVSGGTWSQSSLTVGDAGQGTLNLTDAGVVAVSGTVNLAVQTGASGTVNFGTGGISGTLSAQEIRGGAGTSVMNFNHTGTLTVAAALTGSMSVNKLAGGTTILTGSSSYEGDTVISDGVLIVLGDGVGQSDVSVEDGGTLSGTASLKSVTVHDGGTLAPGTSPGLMSMQDLTMELGATLVMEFSGTGAGEYDQISVQDLFTANGTLNLVILDGYVPVYGDEFQIFTSGGWDAGDFTITTNLGGAFFWDVSELESAGMLTVIPEPSTWTLLVLGSLAVIFLHRRRRAS